MANYYNVAELEELFAKEGLADSVVFLFDKWNHQRATWLAEKEELRNFIFATDTSHTIVAEGDTDWKNRTTLPKLCQIRDNLHANYYAALFPNDDWLKWEGYSDDDEVHEKKETIQAYVANKFRTGGMYDTASQLVYDYIDYGVAIADTIWVNEYKVDPDTDERIPGYVGPMMVRRSPIDVVFNPAAPSFEQSPKITRTLVSMGELEKTIQDGGEEWMEGALAKAKDLRTRTPTISSEDMQKATAMSVDGFGSLHEYYSSGYVELLEFEGSCTDPETGELLDDYIITIMDRQTVVRKEPIPAWKRGGMKVMTGWRKRPDNLYAMGPLDNLVGMQYRVDHLENAKADAWDLLITPMFKIKGSVAEFDFRPGGEVHMDVDGDVQPLTVPKDALLVNSEIQALMFWMEEMAGAPREAAGVRSPGEKTAYEVQALENAAGRIFQQKIIQFETELLEPILNNMLMLAVKNMTGSDIVRVLDDDFGVTAFTTITKEDITAAGKLRPIGARHFSQRAQIIQNLSGVANSGLWPKIERHMSDMQIAKLVEDTLQLERFSLVSKDAGIMEQGESQRLANQMQEDLAVEQATPMEGGEDGL